MAFLPIQKTLIKMISLFSIIFLASACLAQDDHATDSFHIRHYHGKCIEYDTARQKLVFKAVCREHFRWKGGARLIHVPTNKCLVSQGTNDGRILSLTNACSGTDTLFQQMTISQSIKHMISGKCIAPEGNSSDPAENTGMILGSGCYSRILRFWFLPQVLYIIRHFSGLCWKHQTSDDHIFLSNDQICDRFLQKNDKHLQHYATGKCVIPVNNRLKLTSDCSNSATLFDLDDKNQLHYPTTNQCVHPSKGSISPPSGELLGLWGCVNEDRTKTYFYDDKYILDVKILSETCDDYPANTNCAVPKGHITVNGYQYSINTRGINVVVFDYRSAIFEHRSTFDVLGSSASRDNLATLLNNLPSDKILFMSVKDGVSVHQNLADALQRHGVSATYTTNLPKTRCSMASISFTGNYRQSWEKSVNQPNCIGVSTITTRMHIFHDLKGVDDCSEEMGIRTGKLPDSRFSAPSYWTAEPGHTPEQARLHRKGPGWCSAEKAPLSHYLQVDLGIKKLLTGIAIQGHGNHPSWHAVSKFDIQYSLDGKQWKYYNDDSNTKKTFIGVERILAGETKVNWLRRTLARFIRIMPVAKDMVHPETHCIRFELFGCSPKGPIFKESLYDSSTKEILESNEGEVSFYGISPRSKKIEIGISTAATNTALALNIDQQHIYQINDTTTIDNGTIIKNALKITYVKSGKEKKLSTSAKVEYDFKDIDYYSLDISIKNKIIDSQRDSGLNAWNIYSYESEDETLIVAYPLQIKRKPKDESHLNYLINHTNKEEYKNGDELSFNISISHVPDLSFANAYNLHLFIYYDTQYLTLNSFDNIHINDFTINPSKNETRPGFIHLQTNVLWLLTNHFIQFNFKFRFPIEIFKGNNCKGEILIDFSYETNLAKFHGKFNTTLNKLIANKCKISNTRNLITTSQRITVAGFSILYDDVQNDVYICRKIQKYSRRNQPYCYVQRHGSYAWHGIPHIASVVGIDTTKHMLFGVNVQGKSYVQLSSNLQTFGQIEDSIWTSIENQPHVRKAKALADVTLLPNDVDNAWVFPSSTNQIIAATNKGIMRKLDLSWKMVLAW